MKYLTAVYQCADAETAKEYFHSQLRPLFMEDDVPVSVIAITLDDQVSRMDLITELTKQSDRSDTQTLDLIRSLLASLDIDAWRAENPSLFPDEP